MAALPAVCSSRPAIGQACKQPHRVHGRRKPHLTQPAAFSAELPADDSFRELQGTGGEEAVLGAAARGTTAPISSDAGRPGKQPVPERNGPLGWLLARRRRAAADWQQRIGSLGLSAVLAYGLLDGLTSTVAFILCFLAYEARTGVNLAHTPAELPQIMVLVWASKHVTRPFRYAAVAVLAPLADRVLDTLHRRLRLPSRGAAFALCVASMAVCCLSAVGALLLSRWVRPLA